MSETVYRIETNIDDRVYIGSCKDVRHRLLKHQSSLRGGRHTSKAFQDLYDNNKETLCLRVVEVETFEDDAEARKFEKNLIAETDNRLNTRIHSGGGNFIKTPAQRRKRVKQSEETYGENKNFQNNIARGTGPRNPNYRHGKSTKGRKCPKCGGPISFGYDGCISCRDVTGENNGFYGKTHSPETRKILSDKNRGVPHLRDRKRIVVDGFEYPSVTIAVAETGISMATLSRRARNDDYFDVYYID